MKNLFLVFFFLQLNSVAAQTNVPIVKWIDKDVGLTQLSTRHCVIDDNGFVWIATELGLYRYNWSKAQLVEHPKYKNISKQRILDIYKDDETGIIYFRTENEGKTYSIENNIIRQLQDDALIFIKRNAFLKSTHPMFAAIVKYLTQDIKFERNLDDAILTTSYYCIRKQNEIELVHKNGTYKTFHFRDAQNAILMKFNEAIFVLHKETIKVIKNEKYANEKVTTDNVINDFLNSKTGLFKINKVCFINGTYYLFLEKNIYKIQYDAIKGRLYSTFILKCPENATGLFTYDKADDTYLIGSADQGIAAIKPNPFNAIYIEEKGINFSDYIIVKKDTKWYNYNGWIYDTKLKKIDNRYINNYDGSVRFLLEYKGDFFYQAQNNELLSLLDLKTKAPFKNDLNLWYLIGFTYVNNSLWLANEKNCAYLNKNKWIFDSVVRKAIRSNQNINAISAKGDKLIVATTKGVFLHKPFSDEVKYIKGLERVNARYIKHIDKSSFWVGCYGEGLFLVHNNTSYRVVDATIDITTAHAIEEDQMGNLWISTNNGLLTANKQEAISNTLKGKTINCYLYTTKDGLPTDEFNGGSTHPSLKTQDGIIGFPSMKGFVWFNPANVKKNLFSGKIVVDEVILDNAKSAPFKNDIYRIAKNTKILKINFSYGYNFNRENLTLSYKFEDQKSWTEIKGNSFQIGRYKKGVQKLLIRITTHGFDDKYDVVKSVTLDFEPKIYETFWFWTLVVVLLLFLFLLMFQIGTTMQEKRAVELQNKIDEKTLILKETVVELENSKNAVTNSLLEKEIFEVAI